MYLQSGIMQGVSLWRHRTKLERFLLVNICGLLLLIIILLIVINVQYAKDQSKVLLHVSLPKGNYEKINFLLSINLLLVIIYLLVI